MNIFCVLLKPSLAFLLCKSQAVDGLYIYIYINLRSLFFCSGSIKLLWTGGGLILMSNHIFRKSFKV